MVDSSPLQNLTLNSSETACSFPPHRRRPLRSRTYDLLIQILSHCGTGSSQLKLQVDGGDFESIPVSEKDGPVTHNEANADVIVPFPNMEGSKNMIVQEDSNNENKENTGFQDGGFDGKQESIPKMHHAELVTVGEPEAAPPNRISVEDYIVDENLMGDCAIQNASEQKNLDSVFDIQMGDLEVDKEFCIDNFNEVFESCYGMDVESSKGQESRDKGSLLENMPKDAEQELQLKEMELEKLLHYSDGVESSFCPNADEEMEEGEISGEAGVAGETFDALSDDVASHEKRTTEKMHASEDHFDNEELFGKDEDEGRPPHETFDRSVVNSGSNFMKMERRTLVGQMQDCLSQNVLHDNHTESQRGGAITPCLENLTPRGRILQENAAENQIPSTTENGDCASKNKRKRGPLTKEKREKKKKSKRLERAAKNRELGVKRLKLQPVFKEKKIVYCRHYLQGRCHEGDKCNFSHDTVPLTKSKPCSHFARHSCMKGDDCPYDHQLSNYPCTNYASNGFCNRGTDCLFSHEIPAKSSSITPNVTKHDVMSDKGGSQLKSKVTKPELKLLSPLINSNSDKHVDSLRVRHQKVDAIICSTSNSPGKGVELPPAKAVPRTVLQPPRGVSFLSNGGKSAGDTNKEKRDESSTKTPDGVNIGSNSILKVPSGISQLNKVSEGVAPRKPRGINFLSFGPPSTDDSSHKTISNLLSNFNNGADKSVIYDVGEGNRTCSLPQSCGILIADRQMNASATTTSLASGLNEEVNRIPLIVPQNVNSLSFNRSCLDDSMTKETTSFHFNRGDASSSFVKEKESTSKLQGTFKSPSLSFGNLWDQPTDGQNVNSSSFFKKSLFSNTPSLVQEVVQSTLSFAAQLEPDITVGSSKSSMGKVEVHLDSPSFPSPRIDYRATHLMDQINPFQQESLPETE
ncbi:hypothetical protein ACS0TY_023283 [Phlomoides rotata]